MAPKAISNTGLLDILVATTTLGSLSAIVSSSTTNGAPPGIASECDDPKVLRYNLGNINTFNQSGLERRHSDHRVLSPQSQTSGPRLLPVRVKYLKLIRPSMGSPWQSPHPATVQRLDPLHM